MTTADVLKTHAFCRFKNGEGFENREALKHRAYVLEIEGLSKTVGCESEIVSITLSAWTRGWAISDSSQRRSVALQLNYSIIRRNMMLECVIYGLIQWYSKIKPLTILVVWMGYLGSLARWKIGNYGKSQRGR